GVGPGEGAVAEGERTAAGDADGTAVAERGPYREVAAGGLDRAAVRAAAVGPAQFDGGGRARSGVGRDRALVVDHAVVVPDRAARGVDANARCDRQRAAEAGCQGVVATLA